MDWKKKTQEKGRQEDDWFHVKRDINKMSLKQGELGKNGIDK